MKFSDPEEEEIRAGLKLKNPKNGLTFTVTSIDDDRESLLMICDQTGTDHWPYINQLDDFIVL